MVNLTSLALGADVSSQTFNSDFYVTAATVIPVLFLAFVVQGRGFEDLMKTLNTIDQSWRWPRLQWRQALRGAPKPFALFMIAGSILFFGGIGEIVAIIALYNRDSSGDGEVVLLSTILLVITVAAGPKLSLMQHNPPRDTDVSEGNQQPPIISRDTSQKISSESEIADDE